MKRKVYVMDCGDFVKIGVSGNVEQRATQIPYKANRIYSTDKMEDAFKLEREMHMLFDGNRVPEAQGREYFPFISASPLQSFIEHVHSLSEPIFNEIDVSTLP